eukprot:CAMPEP_0194079318 /NCGR_PEP_ID=MMETSP0149-20130528/5542_1 /TAXON_ID=122233 /ORGANISM="Chaetoceros debilis, Strain MM31A-1" /LENGTH=518 /DNA_ID=CAMNT_0038760777 /DNA_START=97 /DNA_END=1653 /DNA_ORIENTATION=-
MGKVTVFAIDGCPHCVRAKTNLRDRNIPYVEINLTKHPDKRSDMLSLSDSLTVPQIFFNEKHIGGAIETIALLELWDTDEEQAVHGSPHERYEKEIKSVPDPKDPRLQPSTQPPAKEPVAPPRYKADKVKIPKIDEDQSILDITVRLSKAIPQSNLSHFAKVYKNAISQQALLDAIMQEFELEEGSAIEFGQYLQKRHVFDHVSSDHAFGKNMKKKLFFRLQLFQKPDVLNSFRVWDDRVDPDCMAIVARLDKSMKDIEDRALDSTSSGAVNLKCAESDDDYMKFQEEVCELQSVDMSKMDVNTRTAFIINIYNLMIKYAQIKHGVPTNNLQRAKFFSNIRVNIGGEDYSFQELENGILRANATPPYSLTKIFAQSDYRIRHVLEKVDCRIHFALNCGARSCPPVKKFSSADLEEELRIVALAFCEQDDNVKLDEERNEILLNTIFKWYKPDFLSSDSEFPSTIVQFLRGERKLILKRMISGGKKIKLKYNSYDWSSNVVESKTFDASALKPDAYPFR